jgi:hypothetical protein
MASEQGVSVEAERFAPLGVTESEPTGFEVLDAISASIRALRERENLAVLRKDYAEATRLANERLAEEARYGADGRRDRVQDFRAFRLRFRRAQRREPLCVQPRLHV